MSPRASPRGGPRARGRPLVAGIGLSHPERVVFPDCGVTKLDLAREIEAWAAPRLTPAPAGTRAPR